MVLIVASKYHYYLFIKKLKHTHTKVNHVRTIIFVALVVLIVRSGGGHNSLCKKIFTFMMIFTMYFKLHMRSTFCHIGDVSLNESVRKPSASIYFRATLFSRRFDSMLLTSSVYIQHQNYYYISHTI